MNFFTTIANLSPEFRKITTSNPGIAASGLSRVHKAHWLAALTDSLGKPLLAVVETENEAARLAADAAVFGAAAAVYPAKDFDFAGLAEKGAASNEYEHRRIAALTQLVKAAETPVLVIATAESAAQTVTAPQDLSARIITIEKDSELSEESIFSRLVESGYSRAALVESVGQFSARGSVIDVFPPNSSYPVRIDMWGDSVESIALFDPETQRSVEKIGSVLISPCSEQSGESTLFDYVSAAVVCERAVVNEQFRAAYEQYKADLQSAVEAGADSAKLRGKHMLSKSELEGVLAEKAIAYFDTFGRAGAAQKQISVSAGTLPPWNCDYSRLKDDLRGYIANGFAAVVFGGTERAARALALDLRDDGFPADYSDKPGKVYAKRVTVMRGTLSAGFEYANTVPKFVCITQRGRSSSAGSTAFGGDIYTPTPASSPTKPKPKKKNKSQAIRALTDINVGDYIVHDSYGIGIFEGVTKLTNDGVSKDYIKLKYAGKDVLYVPVTQLDYIARYIGNTESVNLKLSKLHTDNWFNTRAKAKKAAEELAQELIELYSARMRSKGHRFPPDTPEQIEFEDKFSFIETNDQLICTEQIKRDMQREQPMDRLLCGDVGFGKTEVALRAVFKCVMDGKQCALLCPTTVLAWQHYQTALRRMEGFPINIELLSRFRTTKEKNEIRRNLEQGVIDLIIGTHTLVGKSVRFHNLGLVIIDEEQRFGVTQKEKLKEAFTGVDSLTLTATPIPRTLNMAMSGIRDMSVIETPPHDRIPVTTYVIEHDPGVIARAISKELRRAGQVYYVHNRVETIDSCAAKLHALVPEARIGTAHGKMDENQLMEVWRRLLEREIDLLVCTTLIETGVDVPNVNTLIIENADRMGLAQLHQLRGRVGRTNRRAYAYFTFEQGKEISEIARKRLEAIREFTQFGAGFKIALRDLEIRGAGSVLGESQSGHLSSVGYETYIRLLEEAVTELQAGVPPVADPPAAGVADKNILGGTAVDIKADAYIPETYISNQSQRIACYKRIAEIRDEEDAADVVDELTDRYGVIPKSVNGLISAAKIRNAGAALGMSEITQKGDRLFFYWDKPDMGRISRLPGKFAARIALELTGRSGVVLKLNKDEDVLSTASEFLSKLC